MGQFQDQLDKIYQVEAQGFNPMTESYSTRIGQLPPDPNVSDPPLTADQISKAFVDKGYADPLETLIDSEGRLDETTFNTGLNTAPKVGLTKQGFLGYTNSLSGVMEKTYHTGAEYEFHGDEQLRLKRQEEPKETKVPKYRFEKSRNAKNEDVYLRFDEDTRESDGKEESIAYQTKEAYQEAIDNYKSITGNDPTKGKNK